MKDEGFNVKVRFDALPGFLYGGNELNCGTWMDKMGSSEKAGNKGKPATPRDGSAVELVALCKATVRWLAELHRRGVYPHEGVAAGGVPVVTFTEWNERIQKSFERNFWIGQKSDCQDARPDLIHQRCIYKDTYAASEPWTDYQLRPNFPVAMVVVRISRIN